MSRRVRFYMRGLGIGMLVTALILTIANFVRGGRELSDAEIRARAAELGMVDRAGYSLVDAENDRNSAAGEGAGAPETTEPDAAEAGALEAGEPEADAPETDRTGSAGEAFSGNEPGEGETETAEGRKAEEEGDPEEEPEEEPEIEQEPERGSEPAQESEGEEEQSPEEQGTVPGQSTSPGQGTSSGQNTTPGQGTSSGQNTAPGQGTSSGQNTTPGQGTSSGQNTTPEQGTISGQTEARQEPAADPYDGAETVTIVITSGSGSDRVARQLQEAGLVADAGEFDQYLEQHGYSRSIGTGSFTIPVGADSETIARIITRRLP